MLLMRRQAALRLGWAKARAGSKQVDRAFIRVRELLQCWAVLQALALGRMIGSEKLKRNGFPQPAPQCDPLAASARSFSSVEARGKFPMSGLRVRLHRIARGGRASLEQSRCTRVWQPTFSQSFNRRMSLGTILLIILILLLIGAIPSWPYSAGWGYYPSGGIGIVLIIVLILVEMGRI